MSGDWWPLTQHCLSMAKGCQVYGQGIVAWNIGYLWLRAAKSVDRVLVAWNIRIQFIIRKVNIKHWRLLNRPKFRIKSEFIINLQHKNYFLSILFKKWILKKNMKKGKKAKSYSILEWWSLGLSFLNFLFLSWWKYWKKSHLHRYNNNLQKIETILSTSFIVCSFL